MLIAALRRGARRY